MTRQSKTALRIVRKLCLFLSDKTMGIVNKRFDNN